MMKEYFMTAFLLYFVGLLSLKAQQFSVFEYRLQESAHNPSISIWTTTGTLVTQHLLGSTDGVWTWDTQQIPDGLYFYTLSDTNGVISTGKIAVQH